MGMRRSSNRSNNNSYDDDSISKSGKCLTFEEDFDRIVSKANNIFVTMPAKAAGTTMKGFTKQCVGFYDRSNKNTNFMHGNTEDRIENFVQRVDHPKLVSSHLYKDIPIVDLIQNASRDSLIIYIYREEQERMLSGMREVVQMSVCTNNVYPDIQAASRENGQCIIDEMTIVEKVLKERKAEVKFGNSRIMTCNFYNSIEKNFPNMVFVHYKQTDVMQKVIAKYHCPELLKRLPIHKNASGMKKTNVFVKRETDGEIMGFSEWIDAKRGMFEWTFQLNSENGGEKCQAKTRQLEDELRDCNDGLIQVTRHTSF
eukprot:CAMPEP_0203640986 /NCGR_PEP_ID=MMETSP0088-20131115/6343_1 /ASSEMBLY_ACC=CAM_ASM_001087 /TAXON_ID=426623 /ORGANISM="Chaetoceros affinis, Strain CCMP159" /LENGTH=312 /DNA_ID=CAMNT_0050496325 /DNA_START=73 /DNA_END=1011 /DNA_ORIENTATION=+